MRIRTTFLILLLVVCPLLSVAQRTPAPDALRRDVERARDRVFPALVNILVVSRYFEGGRAQYSISGGSGVIVNENGVVLTNYHVAEDAVRLFCTLSTGERFEARVLAHDPLTDLSILQIRANGNRRFPFAPLGNSDEIKTGDYVLAMGNPLLLASSVTMGIVSNPKRVFINPVSSEIEMQEFERGDRSGMLTRWIQHDALILPGNSGGPLVNLKGEVVGINQLGGSGLGFAIPSNIARRVLDQVLKTGKITRGWLGFSAMPVEKLRRKEGVLVGAVAPESPAERAGLQPGDLILRIDGNPVNARFVEEIPLIYQRIADLEVGKAISVEMERAGQRQTLNMVVAPMEPYYGEEDEFRTLGFTGRDITRPMARARRLPPAGVLVTGTRPGMPLDSAEPKISTGDAIIQVGSFPISNVRDLQKALDAHKNTELIPFTIQRRDEVILSVVRNRPPSEPSPSVELPRPWLGVRTQVITRVVAEALGNPDLKGFRITEVLPYTEASKAGLQVGDLIVEFNGEPLTASRPQDARDLERRVESRTVGEQVQLTILRDGKTQTVSVKLEPTPASAESVRSVRQSELEFTVRDITPIDRMRNRWKEDQTGVLVVEVANGSFAQLGGLKSDDLILAINEQPIPDTKTFQEVVQTVFQQKPPVLVVFVLRNRETTFVFIEPDWSEITP
ncbi:MAG: PDZ domain-containing protein [Fimbriimonadales bacterium]